MKTLYSLLPRLLVLAAIIAAGAWGAWTWWQGQQDALPEGLVSGNGRIESDQVDISTKSASRVTEVLVQEGDMVEAGQVVARIDTDATLTAPVKGRVLYRLANPGEVVSAGGKILTLVDLAEIYMEIYLPAEQAMRVAIGSQARIQFDNTDFVIPARVSFVSPEAQFTPKQVETRSERDKLVFRVKLRIPRSLVERHVEQVKTGVRGTGYARLDPSPPEWPEFLQKRFEGDPVDAGD